MPYIKKSDRLDAVTQPRSVGELNYAVTRLLRSYMAVKGPNYQTLNDIVGALECAKVEFYRRIAVPYENAKLAENGDVYD